MKKIALLVSLMFLSFSVSFAQTYKVTFSVDMRIEINQERMASTDKVTVRGNFNDWGETDLTNDGTGVFSAVVDVPAAKLEAGTNKLFFKYFSHGAGIANGGWETLSDNRSAVVTGDKVLPTSFFNGGDYTKVATEVTFNVDMTLPIKTGFNPTSGKVYVAGNFTDWGTSAVEMTDPDGDKVYSVKVSKTSAGADIKSGDLLIYKFIYSVNTPSNGTWESINEGTDYFGGDKNRIYGVVDGANTVTRFWNNKNPNVEIKDGVISFSVDMSVLERLKVYDPANDVLQIRGGFNGWSDTDKERSVMQQDFLRPSNWFLLVQFLKTEVPSTQEYKYYVVLKNPGIWTDGWERPLSMGGGNRTVTFKGLPNQEEPKAYYDDVHPAFIIPEGTSVSIKFRVDMKDAFDPTKIAIPMKAEDKLYWIAEQPLFARIMGWVDKDEMTEFEMKDPDGDKIYEGTLTVKGPAFNAFEYRYGIQRAADKSWKIEEAGFGKNAYRVRYIPQTGPSKFTQPYTAPNDKWTDKADKSDQVESWPAGLSDIRDLENGLPTNYSLEQNYPNPFNPTTTIRFAIPKDEMVSLKVYNVLGQEVSTLVNQNLKAGSYAFDFDASKLTSGVYFYTIQAGKFNETRKMLLLK